MRPALAAAACRGGSQPPVVGPEVVAPFRDAVRLVHDEPRNLDLVQQLDELIRREALGCDVQQSKFAAACGPGHLAPRVDGHHRMECG